MTNEWQNVQGNSEPMPFSVRDGIYAVLTRNASQIGNDLWQYEEFVIKLEDYNYIVNANSKEVGELTDGLMETFDMVSENVTSIEQVNDALIELYEMIAEKE